MNIKIDIELTPQELRQFIGLPDVAGLQDDMIQFVREKVAKGVENVDVEALKQGIRSSRAWKRLMAVIGPVEPPAAVKRRPARRRSKPRTQPRTDTQSDPVSG
jgi:3'-phosphoadenosine 5'-phosphosulfate sulfotransferase